ncbi:hypothetical protein PB2503_11049 [Parvularcula bermudensis HTCC2503]|uniref:Protein nucleotidyltransferase YdiU n=1 Tax=Parvularcula bermudensis (strain ATCC BAA-594 / HTCC2503 / KCTC 12087) TaxID=314260 RepID=E0THW4_PARBH|nr:YdiU family protein [Parvularcula bermudensis]ADM10257.1 hypothetical protein PB2503_11049 [Parvularcula bermudensis HTCC2503]
MALSNRPATDRHSLFQANVLALRFTQLPNALWHPQEAERVGLDPQLIHLNHAALPAVGLMAAADRTALTRLLAGHEASAQTDAPRSFATVYAGHQFGHFVPQLGDGRAITIAEGVGRDGPFELQLKGAGRTPFSRFGDGRAVLRSVIREYLASEHMAALGVPTTRALSIVASHEGVQRETLEPGAVMARFAPTHVRFGHFEYFHHRGETAHVKALADWVIGEFDTDLADSADPYGQFFDRVVERTAHLCAKWQAVGFAHGVLNTDNMSILGLTIDYGPYGFLDRYDPNFICNHSDHQGRYAFGRQPEIVFWNLRALAVALSSLVPVERLVQGLERFGPQFDEGWRAAYGPKFGMETAQPEDGPLLVDFLTGLRTLGADYPTSFQALTRWIEGEGELPPFDGAGEWGERWRERGLDPAQAAKVAERANPAITLRNWVAETAIRAVERDQDLVFFDRLFNALTAPFEELPEVLAPLAGPPPPELAGLAVSCSS